LNARYPKAIVTKLLQLLAVRLLPTRFSAITQYQVRSCVSSQQLLYY